MQHLALDLRENHTLPAHLLRRLDGIMARDLAKYNGLISELTKGREHSIDWWIGRPATRNNHVSILPARCMQLTLVRELLEEGNSVRVTVDCAALAAVLGQDQTDRLTVVVADVWRNRLREFLSRMGNIGASLFHCIFAAAAAWWTRGGERPSTAAPLSVVNTFVSRQSLVSGEFTDRYFPGLFESLSPEEREQFRYLPVFYRVRNYFSAFRKLRAGKAKFLFYEDHLGIGDYAFAFGHWWRSGALTGRKAHYAGFSVGPLVDLDIRRGRYSSIVARALLAYRFHAGAARKGLRIKSVLDWYEGLDFNHAIAAAINWHAGATHLTGFRSAGSLYYLSCNPTPSEFFCDVVPKNFAVVGEDLMKKTRELCSGLNVVPAPGMRYQALSLLQKPPRDSAKAVLLPLPLSADIARDMLRMIGEAQKLLTVRIESWWVKSHPVLPEAEVLSALGGALPDGFAFVQGNFHDWLGKSDMVIGTGSSALMESAAMGIPTICAAVGNAPTEIPVPEWVDAGISRVVYDENDAAAAIQAMILAAPATEEQRNGLLTALLGSADIEAMRRLAGFEASSG